MPGMPPYYGAGTEFDRRCNRHAVNFSICITLLGGMNILAIAAGLHVDCIALFLNLLAVAVITVACFGV